MSLLSAFGKLFARAANDKHADHQRKKAKKVAFKKTGKKMKKANKRNKHIDGSKTFKSELRKEHRRISKQHKRTEDFINDL